MARLLVQLKLRLLLNALRSSTGGQDRRSSSARSCRVVAVGVFYVLASSAA